MQAREQQEAADAVGDEVDRVLGMDHALAEGGPAKRDAMTPAKAAKPLAEAIPGARTVVLPGCGHMMMSEQPDQVLDALISIL